MITDKQRQKDLEYDGDYQSKSPYTAEQWGHILTSGQLSEDDLALLKAVYASYNHAATLLQLSFVTKLPEESLLSSVNAMGERLAAPNGLAAETDYEGQEYWWYLLFWGKNTPDRLLELKLQPELTEAIGGQWPELEEAYYAFSGDVDRSLQIRYTQEDAVWIAAAALLYEKYYRYPGINSDDILLMQYEVQTRAQKVFGQDVDTNVITEICNADERGHRLNYLRDIYKYYRVSFPGEFGGDRERPEEDNVDYDAYVYSLFGYTKLSVLADFIGHEYAHLVDESYVELNQANGFVRLANFLTRQGGKPFSMDDTSEAALSVRADGEDAQATFRLLSQALLAEYPNFSYARQASWYQEESGRIAPILYDVLHIEAYEKKGASLSFLTVPEGDGVHIEVALNLPNLPKEDVMLDIQEKCKMLLLMTAAPFQVETRDTEVFDLTDGEKIKAFALYRYEDFLSKKEEDIVGMLAAPAQILASYYTDICQNYYPDTEEGDPLADALGSRLVYRKAADTPGPQIIYRERPGESSADAIAQAIRGYGTPQAASRAQGTADRTVSPSPENVPDAPDISGKEQETAAPAAASFARYDGAPAALPPDYRRPPEKIAPSTHPDRSEQGFRLYPKNILIQGPMKTGKYHEAIMTAVGIIEGKEAGMIGIEPVSEVLEHYKAYEEEGRILHISYPDIQADGFDYFIEAADGPFVRDGVFKEFANRCAAGRYVVMMEDVDLNWVHLFGETAVLLRENRREGTSSETAITLTRSKERFRLPSNLYLVATCDSNVCEDTILQAVNQDFYIRHIAPDSAVLRGMRVEGISLQRLMEAINLRLSYFLGASYQLGEGFFLGSSDKDPFISLGRVFREQIIPIFEQWFDGDAERIRYVLGDNAKRQPDTVFYREIPFRNGLFRGSLPDSFDRERRIYQLNEDAFYNPRSYVGIYES